MTTLKELLGTETADVPDIEDLEVDAKQMERAERYAAFMRLFTGNKDEGSK